MATKKTVTKREWTEERKAYTLRLPIKYCHKIKLLAVNEGLSEKKKLETIVINFLNRN